MTVYQVPPERRPVVTVVAISSFAAICLIGLTLALRGLFSPTGQPAGPAPAANDQTRPSTSGPTTPTRFSSPSGNIRCEVSLTAARCDIADRSWQPPSKPETCTSGWGQGLQVTATAAGPVCADGLLGGGPPLAYGQAATRGGFRCESSRTGMECRHESGHSFTLARNSYSAS